MSILTVYVVDLSGCAQVNNTVVKYYEAVPWAAVSDRPLVMMPGAGLTKAEVFVRTGSVQAMAEKGYYTLAIDWPGEQTVVCTHTHEQRAARVIATRTVA
jgi:hypothetical protein